MGSRAFEGFFLSICSPALTATPISPCLGAARGRLCWACAREDPWASPAWPEGVVQKMVAPGAFPADSPAEEVAAVQRGPLQCHLHALALGEPLALSPARIIPGQTFGALLAVPMCGLSENRSCLWKRCFPHSRLPPSLPPAFPHCHFSLD